MIAYVKGKFVSKTATSVIIETNGIGYLINISLNTYSAIEKLEDGLLYTHLLIKEDSHSLYGFAHPEEKGIFLALISVSGVGAATAQLMLSSLTGEQVRTAILKEDDLTFSRVKGIGPKTAKRIILDLKDKIIKDPIQMSASSTPKGNMVQEEALSALLALGFQRSNAVMAIQKVMAVPDAPTTVEDLIKRSLNRLSGN